MGDHGKTITYVLVSGCLSLLLHAVFLGVAEHMQLQLYAGNENHANNPPRRVRIQMMDPRDRIFQRPNPQKLAAETTAQLAESIRSSAKVNKIFNEYDLVEPPKPKLELTGLGKNLLAPELPRQTAPREVSAPRPSILEIDAQNLSIMQLASKPSLTPKLPRQNLPLDRVPSLVSGSDYQSAVGPSFGLGMRLTLPSSRPPDIGQLPGKLIGDDAAKQEGERSGFAPAGGQPPLPGLNQADADRRNAELAQLDNLLSVQVYTYEGGGDDGYFRIDISPNVKSESLQAIPKDILFLIDCSTSISQAQLRCFKDAVNAALDYLNPRDRFNIVSFRERPEPLFNGFVAVEAPQLESARSYLKKLLRGGMTDVYAGLAPFVGVDERSLQRPLNVFLMSDGQSTVKNKLDNQTMIQRIASINRADVSVYAFSAGDSTNLFLLDFLAYNNRGQSLHERDLNDFRGQLIDFITSHSNLIIADLRYRISDGMTESIFPKKLQHLYRGETLSVYGRYAAGTKQMAVQLIGRNAAGNLEELVFRTDLRDAHKVDHSLARDWAAQKVFHLIAEQTLQTELDHSQEIRRLAKHFGFHIPYL